MNAYARMNARVHDSLTGDSASSRSATVATVTPSCVLARTLSTRARWTPKWLSPAKRWSPWPAMPTNRLPWASVSAVSAGAPCWDPRYLPPPPPAAPLSLHGLAKPAKLPPPRPDTRSHAYLSTLDSHARPKIRAGERMNALMLAHRSTIPFLCARAI